MARIQGRYYSINAGKFCNIGNDAHAKALDANALLDYLVNTDWAEGDAHQNWLDTAEPSEIAAWAGSGLADMALAHNDDAR